MAGDSLSHPKQGHATSNAPFTAGTEVSGTHGIAIARCEGMVSPSPRLLDAASPRLQHPAHRRWGAPAGTLAAEVLPGERWLARPDELLTTVVGSGCCVCVRHRASHVSGMVSLLLATRIDALWCIEHCLQALEDLTDAVLRVSGGESLAELGVWAVLGGDVGVLSAEDREFQNGIVSGLLRDYGAPVIELQHGRSRPLSVCFEPHSGELTLSELEPLSVARLQQDLDCLVRLQWQHDQRIKGRRRHRAGRSPRASSAGARLFVPEPAPIDAQLAHLGAKGVRVRAK